MGIRLKGCDISHWQRNDFDFTGLEFVILKATEGKTYKDKTFHDKMKIAKEKGLLVGAYHFARPENNTAVVEAQNFVDSVKPYINECMLCLDWEMIAWNYPITWALDWLKEVERLTGVKPLIYCHYKKAHLCKVIADAGFGLWVVEWDKPIQEPTTTGAWQFWALWQYSATPYDKNYFNGTREQFLKYCRSTLVEVKPVPPVEEEDDTAQELYQLLIEAGWKYVGK